MSKPNVRIVYNSIVPRLMFAEGVTIYPFIFIKASKLKAHPVLLAHEFIHILQVHASGWLKFYLTYLWDYARLLCKFKGHEWAYLNNPAEIEAYKYQWNTSHLFHSVNIVKEYNVDE